MGMLAYNSLLDQKRSSNLNRIEKIPRLVDSLSILQPYKTKRVNQEWLYNRLKELGANSKYVNSDEAWARLIYLNNTDSIAIKWGNKWKREFVVVLKRIGFQSASSFSFFIEQNTFSENEYNTHKSIIEMEKEFLQLTNPPIEVLKSSLPIAASELLFSLLGFAKTTAYKPLYA